VLVGPPQKEPSDADVEDVFARYTSELGRLFHEHKDALPPEVAAHGLRIVRRVKGHQAAAPAVAGAEDAGEAACPRPDGQSRAILESDESESRKPLSGIDVQSMRSRL
jgi:hypothetical protein